VRENQLQYIKDSVRGSAFDPFLFSLRLHSASMNEHEMQVILTPRWHENGLMIGDQKLFLAAWEVMTENFRMNGGGGSWTPSVDFCFLDIEGRCWLLELKKHLTTQENSWSVLFQVTHRSVLFSRWFDFARFEKLYVECRTTSERSFDRKIPKPLLEAHASYFDLKHPLEPTVINALPVQRVVAAQTIGKELWKAASAFNEQNHSEVMTTFGETGLKINMEQKNKERTRFANLGNWGDVLTTTIIGLEIGVIKAKNHE
jgi:hypothetical protein